MAIVLFQVFQHRLGLGDQPDGALHSGSELADGHFQLRRRRQRHPAIGCAAARHQPRVFGPPPALRRVHLHAGQQAFRPRWIPVGWKGKKAH